MFVQFSAIFRLRLSELVNVFRSNEWFRNDRTGCFPLDAKHDETLGCMPQAMTQKVRDIEEIIKTDQMICLNDFFNIHDLLGHQQQRFKGWLHRSIRLILVLFYSKFQESKDRQMVPFVESC